MKNTISLQRKAKLTKNSKLWTNTRIKQQIIWKKTTKNRKDKQIRNTLMTEKIPWLYMNTKISILLSCGKCNYVFYQFMLIRLWPSTCSYTMTCRNLHCGLKRSSPRHPTLELQGNLPIIEQESKKHKDLREKPCD